MAIEGALEGLHVGADHSVVFTCYTTADRTVIQEVSGWTIVLDARPSDQSSTALLSVTGTIAGTFNSDPAVNTQVTTFSIPRALVTPAIFKGPDPAMQYSIWRTDAGSRQPLRHGAILLERTTQSA